MLMMMIMMSVLCVSSKPNELKYNNAIRPGWVHYFKINSYFVSNVDLVLVIFNLLTMYDALYRLRLHRTPIIQQRHHSIGLHTSIWQLSVRRPYRHSSSWIELEAERGRPYRLRHRGFVAGGAEPQEGARLARAWTTIMLSEGAWHQFPDKAPI